MILDLLFPKYCLECKKEGKYICSSCEEKVTNLGWKVDNFSVYKYEKVIRKAVTSLKYKFAKDIADELSTYVFESIRKKTVFPRKEKIILIPIPLHWRRENWRGFNQSKIIGERLSHQFGWKFVPDFLIRQKYTKPQVELKGSERRKNLSGVFTVNQNYLFTDQSFNQTILLFDDVYTTGSTIIEATKTLNKAGFKKIKSLTLTR